MTKKVDIREEGLGSWDQYTNMDISVVFSEIYKRARVASVKTRDWYWQSIKAKRKTSVFFRGLSFFLLICGAVLPILAGFSDDNATRLYFSQAGVASLAFAGLLQAADRVFGWSSGWLRYVTTVTAMEGVTRKFNLDWADYMINKTTPLDLSDKRPLFELAKQMEEDIYKLQSDETEKWVAEFNSSLALLSDLIKSQRESAEKFAEEAHAVKKAQQPGAIEVSLLHRTDPLPVRIGIDNEEEVTVTGTAWSKLQVTPGLHTVKVIADAPAAQTIQKTVDVPARGVARVDVKLF